MLRSRLRSGAVLTLFLGLAVAGCATPNAQPYDSDTQTTPDLASLPLPPQPIVAAVYDFPDMTGQHRETQGGQPHYSKAVTQGGAAVLIRALQDAGRGQWFKVLERNRLNSVLTERQIIRDQRQNYVDANGNRLPPPAPLLYAGVIFEGGIIGYDTNTLTGGAGARFLGMGPVRSTARMWSLSSCALSVPKPVKCGPAWLRPSVSIRSRCRGMSSASLMPTKSSSWKPASRAMSLGW